MDFMKRLKSFGIVVGSFALTAFIAVLPTVEFSNFLGWLHDAVIGWGVPGAVYALVGAFVSQLWFAWRNSVNVNKAGYGSVKAARGTEGIDLY